MKTNKLLVATVLAIAIGAPIAMFVKDINVPQPTTSTGVGVPFLHGFPTGQIASETELDSLERANEWLNSPPLTPSALRGKVVLIDFWTYTCIKAVLDKPRRYEPPARLRLNEWALSGEWTVKKDTSVLNKASGSITYRFHARDLHLVMGPAVPGTSVRFRVLIDGQPPGAAHGIDVDEQGDDTVNQHRLYQLIRQAKPIADRQFQIEFLDSGVEAFAFTFG